MGFHQHSTLYIAMGPEASRHMPDYMKTLVAATSMLFHFLH